MEIIRLIKKMKKQFILLILCLGLVFLLAACTSNAEETNPEEVVNGFLEAFMADDLDRAISYFADDAVYNAVNVDEVMTGKEDVSDYIEFRMRDIVGMETRNLSVDGSQVTWEASLERRSSPTEISYSATVEGGKISYLESDQIISDE